MHHKRNWTLAVAGGAAMLMSAVTAVAQEEPINGIRAADLRVHAITDATVVVRPGETIEHATVVIRDGIIEAVGTNVTPPTEARIWPGEGLTVYAGLIDAAVLVDPGEIERGPYAHWNRHIHPELEASALRVPDDSLAKSLRALGFTAAGVYPEDGILRGSGVILSLAGEEHRAVVYRETSAMAAGFDRGGGYPSSLMGSIATLRQALLDARWYRQSQAVWRDHPQGNEPPAQADALEALDAVITGHQAILFEVSDEHNFLRAARVLDEFNLEAVILGSGLEFRRLHEIAATGLPVVVPVNYPKRPDVSTLDSADSTTLEQMLNWEQAPTNARRLIDAGVSISLTTHGLEQKKDFPSRLRRAINNGLSQDQALAALTITPAKLMGVDHILGTVEPGKVANLVVVDGALFDKKAKIRDTWIDGRRYEITAAEEPGFTGPGHLIITQGAVERVEAKVRIDTRKKSVTVELADGAKAKAKKVTWNGRRLAFLVDGRLMGTTGYVQFAGALTDGSFTGTGAMPDRSRFTFTISPTEEEEVEQTDEADTDEQDKEKEEADQDDEEDTDEAETPSDPVTGEWSATMISDNFGDVPMSLSLTLGDDNTVTGELRSEFFNADLEDGSFESATGKITFSLTGTGMTSRFSGTISENELEGSLSSEFFQSKLVASRQSSDEAKGDKGSAAEEKDVAPEVLIYPLGAFGRAEPPKQQNVLITNATIWTNGSDGIIENGWMIIIDGKIAQVGAGALPYSGGQVSAAHDLMIADFVIDAGGKHVTPGLIDCHSHTGISSGVNEGSQAVTAEVRIGDVINPDDINWYRQLAGGLTAVNQLHGSANPIGGQNSVVRIKWGAPAREFPIEDAIPGIKLALGENVKRSQSRYPNTRMGVEAVIVDAFTRARDYQAEWDRYRALSDTEKSHTMPPRRDLELDALVEILEGERLVHCHSYRQDEVLTLLRTAERFGFTVGTLQHILEGYKVAEAIAAHGAGASTFSDWWAYKIEVMDAIPFNGAMMHDAGVVVSFNSDSSELARRLNTEAAKAVRYGGLEPEEALKFVTLNPAKQLRIDHRKGSLEVGKDADFVIWSGDPLSTYSVCEQTWIDGARYFSLEEDELLREQVTHERERLIQKILAIEHGKPEAKSKDEEPKDGP